MPSKKDFSVTKGIQVQGSIKLGSKIVTSFADSAQVAQVAQDAATASSITAAGGLIASTYDSADLLPAVGNTTGDFAFVNSINRLFLWNGAGWYNIAIVNATPELTTTPNSSYTLDSIGSSIEVTIVATDPENFPITYTATPSDSGGSLVSITQDSGVFTVAPLTQAQLDSNGFSNGGTFSITFKASDGVNIAPAVSSFTLTGLSPTWTSHSLSQSLQHSGTQVASQLFGEVISVDGNYAVITARNLLYQISSTNVRGKAYVFFKSSGTWSQQAELSHTDTPSSNYGIDAAISGNTVAVADSAGNGAVRIFTRSGTTWSLQQKITGNSTTMNGFADGAMQLSGDRVAVGCYAYATPGASTGRIAIFNRSGSTWSFESFLDASDAAASDLMGYYNVSISGNYVIAGVPAKEAAYIWFYNGSSWSQQAKITASDGSAGNNFGLSVAIDGDIAVVGASNKTSETGAAYVFTRSGTSWTQTTILGAGGTIPSDLSTGDQFGYVVDIDENSLIVSAPNVASPRGNGSAYIFTTSNSGASWTQRKKFTTTSGDITDNYGYGRRTVAIDETSESIVVGAYEDDTGATGAGKVYFYED